MAVNKLLTDQPAVLVVDDDESMRDILQSILKKDYHVYTAGDLAEARQFLQNVDIHLVLLDIRLNQENGLTFLPEIKETNDQIEVIVITVLQDLKTAVSAMKLGAFDYINKDFNYDELRSLLDRAVEKQRTQREIICLRQEVKQQSPEGFVIGRSPAMLKVREVADSASELPVTVLITGETGTGKELLARYIHQKSHVADKPFVTVNLSAIPPELSESILFGHERGAFTGAHQLHYGKFELAHGGTLFLDEIGELRYDLQAKLLRVLQENEIERVGGNKLIPIRVRLIVATNVNLMERIQAKEFREDLYYRLNVVPIQLPPLKERLEDIPQLVQLFLGRYNRKFNRHIQEFKPEVLEALSLYHWPGNIRELENFVERIVAISHKESIGLVDIPLEYQLCKVEKAETMEGEDFLQKTLDTFERRFLIKILEEEDWNQTQAAKRLGIHRKTLEYKIKRLDLGDIIDSERGKTDE